ncbi:MAG: hypothetical protein SGCHY_005086 [Lobulomycetales sp.]
MKTELQLVLLLLVTSVLAELPFFRKVREVWKNKSQEHEWNNGTHDTHTGGFSSAQLKNMTHGYVKPNKSNRDDKQEHRFKLGNIIEAVAKGFHFIPPGLAKRIPPGLLNRTDKFFSQELFNRTARLFDESSDFFSFKKLPNSKRLGKEIGKKFSRPRNLTVAVLAVERKIFPTLVEALLTAANASDAEELAEVELDNRFVYVGNGVEFRDGTLLISSDPEIDGLEGSPEEYEFYPAASPVSSGVNATHVIMIIAAKRKLGNLSKRDVQDGLEEFIVRNLEKQNGDLAYDISEIKDDDDDQDGDDDNKHERETGRANGRGNNGHFIPPGLAKRIPPGLLNRTDKFFSQELLNRTAFLFGDDSRYFSEDRIPESRKLAKGLAKVFKRPENLPANAIAIDGKAFGTLVEAFLVGANASDSEELTESDPNTGSGHYFGFGIELSNGTIVLSSEFAVEDLVGSSEDYDYTPAAQPVFSATQNGAYAMIIITATRNPTLNKRDGDEPQQSFAVKYLEYSSETVELTSATGEIDDPVSSSAVPRVSVSLLAILLVMLFV